MNTHLPFRLFLYILVFCFASSMQAQEADGQPETQPAEEEIDLSILTDSIRGEKGNIALPDYHSGIQVPDGYQYLDKAQAGHLLTDYWNNPEDEDVLGVLVPDTARIFYDVSIAYLVFYINSGYVSDKDAADIDYDDLLKDLQEVTAENNKERVANGYAALDLIGWAIAPKYDRKQHVLNWAKHLRVSGEEDTYDVLNYDIRVLGREGFVIVQAVADLEDCQAVEAAQAAICGSIRFDKGYTYADFDSRTDRLAEWTIGGLIAGKVLAKAGLLAKLGVFLLKFWKLILVAVMAAGAPLLRYFRRKKKTNSETLQDDNRSPQ